jgi:hypothetical protein
MLRVLPLVFTLVVLLLTACVLMTLAVPAWAAPFDFSADYHWQWELDGPVLLRSGNALGVAMRLRPLPLTDATVLGPVIHFSLGYELPPVQVGGTLTVSTSARILGSDCPRGAFICSDAIFSLVGEAGGWALASSNDLPAAATPEPATLLLVGTGAAGVGLARWWKRRRAPS